MKTNQHPSLALHRNNTAVCASFVTACVWLSIAHWSIADENKAQATAPDNHVELAGTLSGSIFVAKPLKEQYDALVARLEVLRDQIEGGRISGADAQRDLQSLRTQLQELRTTIEKNKVFVPVAMENKKTETLSFDLGNERCLVITADNVRIIGWDQPTVKCELEKVVLSANDESVDEHFEGIKIVHENGRAPNVVGNSLAESQSEEQKFLESEDGKKLTDRQREGRRKLIASIEGLYSIFSDFQGKEIDTIAITGLTGQEGNSQMTLEITSNEGGSYRSVWRRHARLTVYVPQCKAMAVRGGLEFLDVQDVKTSLVITGQGSHNRDYDGEFKVQGVDGSVVVSGAPINVIDDISGNVTIIATMDYANSGTQHDGGSVPGSELRTHYFYPPLPCTAKSIRGDLTAWFGRVDFNVEDVAGKIDIRNEFGDTTITTSTPIANSNHRVVSEAGRIEWILTAKSLGDLPFYATTQCGNVRTNAPEQLLDSFSVSGTNDQGVMSHWSGFRRPPPGGFDFCNLRLDAALAGENRDAGVDVISRGGTVVVTVKSE